MKRIFTTHKIATALFTIMLLASCQDYFMPEIDTMPSALVVQCLLTDNEECAEIRLNHSAAFNARSSYSPEKEANVTIISSDGFTYATQEITSGLYRTTEKMKAKRGVEYQLKITTKDGEIYESSVETLTATNEIDSIFTEVAETVNVKYDNNGIPIATNDKGIQFSVKPSPAEHLNMGFIYKWEALMTYNVNSEIPGMPPIAVNYYCWSYGSTNNFMSYNLVNSATMKNLPKTKLNFMPYQYIDPLPIDSFRYAGLVVFVASANVFYKLHQYTLPKKQVEFWENIEKQAQASGKLFDPVESQIIGNIECTSHSNKLVFGYFQVASYNHKTIKIQLKSLRYGGQKYVSDIPVPPKDSIYYTNVIPEFW